MRATSVASVLALVLVAVPLGIASPTGGSLLMELRWGEAGELSHGTTFAVTPQGLTPAHTVLARFELPEDAQGVYATATWQEADTAWIDRGFTVHLTQPSGASWSIVGGSTLAVGHCPMPGECRYEWAEGHAPSTPVLARQAGVYEVRVYGSTTAAYGLEVRTV